MFLKVFLTNQLKKLASKMLTLITGMLLVLEKGQQNVKLGVNLF